MGGTTRTSVPTDPPVTGASGELRVRRTHPFAAAPDDADPLTVRLLFLLRTHPGLARFRIEDVTVMDVPTKAALVAEIDAALGLDKPAPRILPSGE
jgi:hypothetical protein